MTERKRDLPRPRSHRHPELGHGDPYEVMASIGIDASHRASEIHKAGMTAQRQGSRRPELFDAWTALRNKERRLVLDLGFVHIVPPDPDAADLPLPSEPPPDVASPATAPEVTLIRALGPLPEAPERRDGGPLEPPGLELDAWALALDLLDRVGPGPRPETTVASFLEEG